MTHINLHDYHEMMTAVPCYVELSIGGGAERRSYGPFESVVAAREWCERQAPQHFAIIPMRRIDKEREYYDWYNPEFDDESFVSEFVDLKKA